jgi:nucleoside phosphorylase
MRAASDAHVVIFAALGWEVRPVLAALDDVRRDPLPGFRSWVGRADDVDLRVVKTGIGAQRAGAAATQACGPGVRTFLATGCAGGLSPALTPGDLVLATSVVDQSGVAVPACTDHLGGALQRWAATHGLVLHAGRCVSVTQPLGTVADKRETNRRLGAVAVDMEGAAIASVAAARGIGFVGLRAILDPADEAVPDMKAESADGLGDGGIIGPLTAYVLRHPSVLPALVRLASMRRAARAALERFFRVFVDDRGAALIGGPRAVG